jgi:hypothetical protein
MDLDEAAIEVLGTRLAEGDWKRVKPRVCHNNMASPVVEVDARVAQHRLKQLIHHLRHDHVALLGQRKLRCSGS